MIDALYISENALRANQEWISNISNNVANINTPGFKKQDVNFSNMIANTSAQSGDAKSIGLGAELQSLTTDFKVGQLKHTGAQLDIAIDGDGFIEVLLDDGSLAYTKQGRLAIAADGQLVLSNGHALTSSIYIPPNVNDIKIETDGRVVALLDGGASSVEVGEITLAKFSNPQSLNGIGEGLYVTTTQSGQAEPYTPGEDGVGKLVQGFVEMSNVDLVDEMSSIMLAQRSYQINARLLQVTDQIMETINNLRR